jgi:peroxiredoxin
MTSEGSRDLSSRTWFSGRRVVMFAVPGAFTPTCSAKHLPGFIKHTDEILAKGVDVIGCMSVNDVFVMDAWGKSTDAAPIEMLADGNAEFTHALGMEKDSSSFGMGVRSKRFALIANDGVITNLFVEAPGEFRVSSAENVLANL